MSKNNLKNNLKNNVKKQPQKTTSKNNVKKQCLSSNSLTFGIGFVITFRKLPPILAAIC
jgi:hypothetical protein